MESLSMQRLFDNSSLPSLVEFDRLCSQTVDSEAYPLAARVEKNVPVYDLRDFQPDTDEEVTTATTSTVVSQLQDEWYRILLDGPGVFVLKGMYCDGKAGNDNITGNGVNGINGNGITNSHTHTYADALSKTTTTYQHIISQEQQAKGDENGGDHFASKGTNDRIWNSFSKHALLDPASFVTYYSNPWLAHVSTAWLGPSYRITAQVNVVKPGGKQQNAHRDYHLGFQDDRTCRQYPRTMHIASQFLTLQGAIAHTDMPLESGPTWLLPFSQQFAEGYLAWRLPEFERYFDEHFVSLPLDKGDGIFFNPALFHAAGANRTRDFERMANLLQVSCAFGRTMESVDSVPVVERCWDEMVQIHASSVNKSTGGGTDTDTEISLELSCLIRAIADGYPFPTNLDRRPPATSGLAPESEQDILVRGLKAGWSRERVVGELRQMRFDSADGAESLAAQLGS